MPYRDPHAHGPQRVFCHRHPTAAADVSCSRCGVTLCEPCVTFSAARASCFPCATRRARRASHASRAALSLVMMSGLALGIVGGVHRRPTSGFEDTGAERCDSRATFAYERSLLDRNDFGRALLDIESYERSCGDWIGVHEARLAALRGLRRTDEALAEACYLIWRRPSDAEYYEWRSATYAESGRTDAARLDHRKACRLTTQQGAPSRFGCGLPDSPRAMR